MNPQLIPVKIGNNWGAIFRSGEVAISPEFDHVFRTTCPSRYAVRDDEKWGLIGSCGEQVLAFFHRYIGGFFSPSYCVYQAVSGMYGFLGKDGEPAIHAQYSDATEFSEGLSRVTLPSGDVFFVTEDGAEVFRHTYCQSRYSFSAGRCIIQEGALYGFIDTAGEVVIPPTYSDANPRFHQDGLLVVSDSHGYFVVDIEGNQLFSHRFDTISYFAENIAPARNGSKWGYVDRLGQVRIGFSFEATEKFHDKLGVVRKDDRWGVIDLNGEFVIDPVYFGLRPLGNGVFSANEGEVIVTQRGIIHQVPRGTYVRIRRVDGAGCVCATLRRGRTQRIIRDDGCVIFDEQNSRFRTTSNSFSRSRSKLTLASEVSA